MTDTDLGAYCRAIETHLCRLNGGHLIRVVGPAFELAKAWHASAVPLKIVLRGIERRVERAARAAASARRPLRLEFCEADVLDVLDEWRRAVGFALYAPAAGEGAPNGAGEDAGTAGAARVASLPRHLERVTVKLSSFLAMADDAPALRRRAETLLGDLDALREPARTARGEARAALLARLSALDEALLSAIDLEAPPAVLAAARQEASDDLAAYAGRMRADDFTRAVDRATRRIARDRLGLPVIAASS